MHAHSSLVYFEEIVLVFRVELCALLRCCSTDLWLRFLLVLSSSSSPTCSCARLEVPRLGVDFRLGAACSLIDACCATLRMIRRNKRHIPRDIVLLVCFYRLTRTSFVRKRQVAGHRVRHWGWFVWSKRWHWKLRVLCSFGHSVPLCWCEFDVVGEQDAAPSLGHTTTGLISPRSTTHAHSSLIDTA